MVVLASCEWVGPPEPGQLWVSGPCRAKPWAEVLTGCRCGHSTLKVVCDKHGRPIEAALEDGLRVYCEVCSAGPNPHACLLVFTMSKYSRV